MFGCCVCCLSVLFWYRMEAKNQSRISRGNENPSNRRRTTNKQEDDEDEAQILEIEPDRISELPDSLLIHILSLLPSLNHVIRTGTLSKRWLRLWTFVPNLVFSPLANVLFPDLYSSARFVYNVHRTLVQSRVSKIEKFSVQIPYCAPLKSVVDSWVHFVTTNNIDDLSLRFINLKLGDFYILPQNLCTSSSLKVLELKNCAFAPVGLISWNSLRSLSLKCMNLSNGVLEVILSGCPVLEILEVLYYYGLSRLKVTSPSLRELVMSDFKGSFDKDNHHHRDAYLAISAPNLRMLTISSCFYTWNVRLEDVKSLVVADLSFYLDIDDSVYDNVEEYEKYGDLLQELIEKLHHVKELKLGQWCIQVLSVLELKGLPSPLLSCKSLKLDLQVANDDLPGIAKLLEISPYLETLLISNSLEFFVGGCLFDADSFEGENYLQLRQTIPKGFLLHLKNVKIFGFRREHCEVELVEFLLKNAKALENMNIHLQREDVPWQSEYSVWGEIGNGELNLPASSATIRFFASPENSCETMLLRV